jgi:sugar diacid utilization regulator
LRSAAHRLLLLRPEPNRLYLERKKRDARGVGHVRGKVLTLTRAFVAQLGRGMATAIDDGFVMLVQVSDGADVRALARHICAVVHRAYPDLGVRVSVSAPCLQPRDFAHRYEEAAALLELAERLESPDPVICYDDWSFYGLLLRAGRRQDIDELIHRVLDPLVVQDGTSRGELLPTLQAFLDHNLSPKRTAAALYVHPNTVKYRLRRIGAVLGCDLEDLDQILTIKMALMVRNLDPARFDRLAAMHHVS